MSKKEHSGSEFRRIRDLIIEEPEMAIDHENRASSDG